MTVHVLFTQEFLITLRSLVGVHHSIYPRLPPQGIYFECLVEQAFKQIRVPFTRVEPSSPNTPKHDLLVGNDRISLKTETGKGTRRDSISITKLCTTEREPWDAETLVKHAVDHLSRYEHMLMLRAVWDEPLIHYQLVDIPTILLRRVSEADVRPVGRRKGRRSIAGDVTDDAGKVFHVHFDGADGKCQIQRLPVSRCNVLLQWDLQLGD